MGPSHITWRAHNRLLRAAEKNFNFSHVCRDCKQPHERLVLLFICATIRPVYLQILNLLNWSIRAQIDSLWNRTDGSSENSTAEYSTFVAIHSNGVINERIRICETLQRKFTGLLFGDSAYSTDEYYQSYSRIRTRYRQKLLNQRFC